MPRSCASDQIQSLLDAASNQPDNLTSQMEQLESLLCDTEQVK